MGLAVLDVAGEAERAELVPRAMDATINLRCSELLLS